MITRGYFSHNIPPSGYNVFAVLDKKGYCYAIAGENIGWNNYPDNVATGAVHQAFMKSPGHRSNILGKKWDVIGVGAYKGPTGKKMWTVIFADKCGGSSGGGSSGGGQRRRWRRRRRLQDRPEAEAQADAEAHAQADPGQDDAAAPDRSARARARTRRPVPERHVERRRWTAVQPRGAARPAR